MKQTDFGPLYQYMYLREIRQENAYIQLENNLGFANVIISFTTLEEIIAENKRKIKIIRP